MIANRSRLISQIRLRSAVRSATSLLELLVELAQPDLVRLARGDVDRGADDPGADAVRR